MADPMEYTPATGTTLDDNIDKDEIEIVPERQLNFEEVNRWLGIHSPVLSRMLARLKKLSPDAGELDEDQDLGGGSSGVEYLPNILYKAPEMVIGEEFVDFDVEGVYTITGPFSPESGPEYFYVNAKGSFVFTGEPVDEDAGDAGEGDCYVLIELPFPAAGSVDRVIGEFGFKDIFPTDTGTPAYSMNIESQVDPAYEDWYRYFAKLSFNINNVYTPLLPSETAEGSRLYFDFVYKANAEVLLDLDIPTDQLISWWDYTDIDMLFQDSAGTLPVTADGQVVNRVNDKFGTNHISRSSGNNTTCRYVDETSDVLGPGVFFNTTAATLQNTGVTGFNGKNKVSIIIIVRHISAFSSGSGHFRIQANAGPVLYFRQSCVPSVFGAQPTHEIFDSNASGHFVRGGTSLEFDAIKMLEIFFDGTQADADKFVAAVNGNDRIPTSINAFTMTTLPASGALTVQTCYEGGASGTHAGSGVMYGVLAYGKILTDDERRQIFNYYVRPKGIRPADRSLGIKVVSSQFSRTAPGGGTIANVGTIASGGDLGIWIRVHNGTVTPAGTPTEWNQLFAFADGLSFSTLSFSILAACNYGPTVSGFPITATGSGQYSWVWIRLVGGYNTMTSGVGLSRQSADPKLATQTCINGGIRLVGASVINTTGVLPDFGAHGYTLLYTSPAFVGTPDYYPHQIWYKEMGPGDVEPEIDFTGTIGTTPQYILWGVIFEK